MVLFGGIWVRFWRGRIRKGLWNVEKLFVKSFIDPERRRYKWNHPSENIFPNTLSALWRWIQDEWDTSNSSFRGSWIFPLRWHSALRTGTDIRFFPVRKFDSVSCLGFEWCNYCLRQISLRKHSRMTPHWNKVFYLHCQSIKLGIRGRKNLQAIV